MAQGVTEHRPGSCCRIMPGYRLNYDGIRSNLKRWGEVYIESIVDPKERQLQSTTIHNDARSMGLNVGVCSGWMLGDYWTPKKKGDTQPEGSEIYLHVRVHQ